MLLPRWVQVVAGIVLLAWAGLSLAGSIALLRMEPPRNWLFFKTVSVVLLLASAWVLSKAWALIRGPGAGASPLLSPWVIRLFAIGFGAMPLLALLLGTASFWEIAAGGAFNLIVAAQLLRAVGRGGADEHDDE